MSRAWAGGSTNRWRKIRLLVLVRDGWICQLCGDPIDPSLPKGHPRGPTVHHTRGKVAGDDPAHLVAAHTECNVAAGDPNRHDPQPVSVTDW